MGAYEVAVSDTIGIAHPGQVRTVLAALLAPCRCSRIALHFHDTRGTALANVLASLGFRRHNISMRPPAASADARTLQARPATWRPEDLLYLLHGLGLETGVSLDAVYAASTAIEPVVGHALPSRYVRARAATATPHDDHWLRLTSGSRLSSSGTRRRSRARSS
jgi:hydroxymethylglutaryl-CoA lyase